MTGSRGSPPARASGRRGNGELILATLGDRGSVERTALADATGLEQRAVATALGPLLDDGKVIEDAGGLRLGASSAPARSPRRGRSSEHLRLRGEQRASDAATDPAVAAVRHRLLGDALLEPDDVPAWIERHREGAPPVTYRLLGPPALALPDDELIDGSPIIEYKCPALAYQAPGFKAACWVPSTAELEPLRQLSETLAKRYGWTPAQATVYVLTDAIPLSGIRVATRRVFPTPGGPTRWAAEFDADEDPQLIADAIRRAQRDHGIGRRRKLEDAERLALVAEFVAEHGSGDLAWRQWNRDHPRDRYADRRSLWRAAQRASDR